MSLEKALVDLLRNFVHYVCFWSVSSAKDRFTKPQNLLCKLSPRSQFVFIPRSQLKNKLYQSSSLVVRLFAISGRRLPKGQLLGINNKYILDQDFCGLLDRTINLFLTLFLLILRLSLTFTDLTHFGDHPINEGFKRRTVATCDGV